METNRKELLQNAMTSLPDQMQSAGVAMRAMEHNWKMLFSNADGHS